MTKLNLFLCLLLFSSFLIFTGCTSNGAEMGLVGTWELQTVDYNLFISNVEGQLIINWDDTFSGEVSYNAWFGSTVTGEFRGTVKACAIDKLIQFFINDFSGADTVFVKETDKKVNCTYTLIFNTLTIKTEKNDSTVTLTFMRQ